MVTANSTEPLVPVVHQPRVVDLTAYAAVGWPGAAGRSLPRSGAAHRLGGAAARLPEPFGVAVFDGWRPLDLQQAIYDAAYADTALPAGFVSVPSSDPSTPLRT